MDSLQMFILLILVILFLAGVHRRATRYSLVKYLEKQGKSSDEIIDIMEAYDGRED